MPVKTKSPSHRRAHRLGPILHKKVLPRPAAKKCELSPVEVVSSANVAAGKGEFNDKRRTCCGKLRWLTQIARWKRKSPCYTLVQFQQHFRFVQGARDRELHSPPQPFSVRISFHSHQWSERPTGGTRGRDGAESASRNSSGAASPAGHRKRTKRHGDSRKNR